MTLTMDRIPFWFSLGVGTPARDPSPRNRGLSSVLASWAASRIVKGLTRTATVIEEAPSEEAMMEFGACYSRQVAMLRGRGRSDWRHPAVGKGRLVLTVVEFVESNDERRRMCGAKGVWGTGCSILREPCWMRFHLLTGVRVVPSWLLRATVTKWRLGCRYRGSR